MVKDSNHVYISFTQITWSGFAGINWHWLGNSGRRQWQSTPVLLPGKSHGRRSLVSYSLWGCEESDTTERLHFHFSLSCLREGNGNLLQCSWLKNPRDGGAWWASVSGVAQSRTRLKWLSRRKGGYQQFWKLIDTDIIMALLRGLFEDQAIHSVLAVSDSGHPLSQRRTKNLFL